MQGKHLLALLRANGDAVSNTVPMYLLHGLYFGHSDPGSTYGAAGRIILLMLWVSLASLILLYGAEFTRHYARRFGETIAPSGHAEKQQASPQQS